MENLSLEEKIATFKKKIDELDPLAAPASGGPHTDPSVPPNVGKEFEKEFEKGKISAMKNKLVRKGLSVVSGDRDTAAALAVDEPDEQERRPELSEAEKAARLAAEFEKGKIAAMKNRLASKGLDFDTATVAAEAIKAGEAVKAAAAAAAAAAASDDGDDSAEFPAVSNEQQMDGGIADESGDSPSIADADNGENDDVANTTTESKDEKEESPHVPLASASDVGDTEATESNDEKHESPPVVPAEASELPEGARPQGSSAKSPTAGEKGEEEEPSSKVNVLPAPPATVVPDDADAAPDAPMQDMNASSDVDPAAAAPTSTPLPATDLQVEGDTPERAPESCPKIEDSNATQSEAEAPQAATKEHALPQAQGNAQREEGQQRPREPPIPGRKTAPSQGSPESASKGAQPAEEAQTGLPSSSKRVVAGRYQSKPNEAKGPESSPDGTVSLVTSSTPATRGLRTPPVGMSPGPAAQRRRSSTGFSKGLSTWSQQQAAGSTARPATAETPAVRITPEVAEESGKRLHEQARQSRERVERRRQEVLTSPLSPFTPRLWSNPRMGNPSLAGTERLESLYRDAIERNSKMEMARRAAERPSECTFTPEISRKAANRKREKRVSLGGESDDSWALEGEEMSTFDALYLDAKRRRAKMDALYGFHLKEAMTRASPVITARGRQASAQPLEIRLRENAERWARHWKDLEERKLTLEQAGCTFSPNFNIGCSASAPRMRSRRYGCSLGGIPSFVERSDRFQAEREKKMERLKQEAMERERAEATFRPKMFSFREGDSAGAAGADVFERLARAATEQELNKSARKEELWRQEREKCNDFKPQLPSRSVESPSDPLDERIKKSTEEWIKNRAAREQRRRELEAEQCTFRPSLSGVKARRASVDPRLLARSTPSSGQQTAPDAFAVRSAALQEAREQRLEKMRKEKMKLELKEATFQPVTGNARRVKSSVSGSAGAAFYADAMATGDALAEGCEAANRVCATPLEDNMGEAQRKFSASEAKEPVDFKASMMKRGEEKDIAVDRAVAAEAEVEAEPEAKVEPEEGNPTVTAAEGAERPLLPPLPPPPEQEGEQEGGEGEQEVAGAHFTPVRF